jgi:arsenite-transporting ATPase
MVEALGAGAVTIAGSRSTAELLDLAPPGIDELLGLVSMMEALEAKRFSVIVIDAAPTGHALRLLEMTEAARGWVQALIAMVLKYRRLVRPGKVAGELVALSRSIRSLQELLHSPVLTRFIVVTRAAAVPRHETGRLLKNLRRLRVRAAAMVINAIILSPGRCDRCRKTAALERRQAMLLARTCRLAFRDCVIIQAPLVAPPPRGVEALERWAHQWMT